MLTENVRCRVFGSGLKSQPIVYIRLSCPGLNTADDFCCPQATHGLPTHRNQESPRGVVWVQYRYSEPKRVNLLFQSHVVVEARVVGAMIPIDATDDLAHQVIFSSAPAGLRRSGRLRATKTCANNNLRGHSLRGRDIQAIVQNKSTNGSPGQPRPCHIVPHHPHTTPPSPLTMPPGGDQIRYRCTPSRSSTGVAARPC